MLLHNVMWIRAIYLEILLFYYFSVRFIRNSQFHQFCTNKIREKKTFFSLELYLDENIVGELTMYKKYKHYQKPTSFAKQ